MNVLIIFVIRNFEMFLSFVKSLPMKRREKSKTFCTVWPSYFLLVNHLSICVSRNLNCPSIQNRITEYDLAREKNAFTHNTLFYLFFILFFNHSFLLWMFWHVRKCDKISDRVTFRETDFWKSTLSYFLLVNLLNFFLSRNFEMFWSSNKFRAHDLEGNRHFSRCWDFWHSRVLF